MRGSSVQPARLNAVLQDLYSMEVLATMLEGCQKLVAKMATQHGVTAPTAGNLMQDLAGASAERWSNSSRFAAIADKYGATLAQLPGCLSQRRQSRGTRPAAQGLRGRPMPVRMCSMRPKAPSMPRSPWKKSHELDQPHVRGVRARASAFPACGPALAGGCRFR